MWQAGRTGRDRIDREERTDGHCLQCVVHWRRRPFYSRCCCGFCEAKSVGKCMNNVIARTVIHSAKRRFSGPIPISYDRCDRN